MEFKECEEPKSCPCYQKCDSNWDFTKIVGNEDAGIEVYKHRPQKDDLNIELLSPKTSSTDGNTYIIHKTCALPLYPDDFLPTFDTCHTECPRCKKNVIHAQRLLRKVPIIDNVVIGICDHCINQTKQTCKQCEKIIKKFITTKDRPEVECKKIKTCSRDFRQLNTEIFNEDDTNEIDENIAKEFNKYDSDKKIHKMEKKSHSPDFNVVDDRIDTNSVARKLSKRRYLIYEDEDKDYDKQYKKELAQKNEKKGRQSYFRKLEREIFGANPHDVHKRSSRKYWLNDKNSHYNVDRQYIPTKSFGNVDDDDSYAARERIEKNRHDENKYYYEKYDVPTDKESIDMKYSQKAEIFSDNDDLYDIYQKRKHRVKKYERTFGYEGRKEYNNLNIFKKPRYQPTKNRFKDFEIDINDILNDRVRGEFRNLNKEYEREKWKAQYQTCSRTLQHLELGLSDDDRHIKNKKRKKQNYLRRSISDTLLNYTIPQESKIIPSEIQVKSIISDTLVLEINVSQEKSNEKFQKLKDSLELGENKFISDQNKFYKALAKLIEASILSDDLMTKRAKRERGKLKGRQQKAKTPISQKLFPTIELKSDECLHREFGKIFITEEPEKEFQYLFPKKRLLAEEIDRDNSADLIAKTMEKEYIRLQEKQRKQKVKEEKERLKNEKIFVEEMKKQIDIGGTDQGKKDIIDSEKKTVKGKDDDIINKEVQTVVKGKQTRAEKQITDEEYNENDKQKHTEEQLARNDNRKRGKSKKPKIRSDVKTKFAMNKRKRIASKKIKMPNNKKKISNKLDHSMRTSTDNYEAETEMQLSEEMLIIQESLQDPQKYRQLNKDFESDSKVVESAREEKNKIPDGDELQQEIKDKKTTQDTPPDDQLMTSPQKRNDDKNNQLFSNTTPQTQKNKLFAKKFPQTQEVDNNNLLARKSAREEQNKIPDGDELQQEINDKKTTQDTPPDDQLMTSPQKRNDDKNDQLFSNTTPQTQKNKLFAKKFPQTQEVDNNNLLARKSLEKQNGYENLDNNDLLARKSLDKQNDNENQDNNDLLARKSLEKQNDYENLTEMSQQAQKDDKNEQVLKKKSQKDVKKEKNLQKMSPQTHKGESEEKSLSQQAQKDNKNDQELGKKSLPTQKDDIKNKILPKISPDIHKDDDKGVNKEKSFILEQKDGNLDAVQSKKIKENLSATVKPQKKISREDPLGANVTSTLKKEHSASDLPKGSNVFSQNEIESEKPRTNTKIPTIFKQIDIKNIRMIKTDDNDKLVNSVKNSKKEGFTSTSLNERKRGKRYNYLIKEDTCNLCHLDESDSDNLVQTEIHESSDEIIIIDKIHKHKNIPLIEKKDNVPFEFTKTSISENFVDKEQEETTTILGKKQQEPEKPRGFMRYALSDRTFIDKGWTILPTEEVVRKVNVYRMRPSHPEFDWFFLNKNKGLINYDTGEKFAEIDEKGRGRWFYKNGTVALEYYDCEELNAKQRVVVYGNGKPDVSGRSRPATILATFDYLGNAVVLDHTGKIRLKYNQSEGVMLDRSLGPLTSWKWHSLNDPPELLQVMVDTQLRFKDRDILNLSDETEQKHQKSVKQEEEVVAIELKKIITDQSKDLTRKYKPYQIRMKALKINDCFALRVVDQATVHLFYRDGKMNTRLNLGMLLDHHEIIATDLANVGLMTADFQPAKTDSLVAIQRNVDRARRFEQVRIDREQRIRSTLPQSSADKLIAAATRPRYHAATSTVDCGNNVDYSCTYKYKKPSCCSVYYNTRIV